MQFISTSYLDNKRVKYSLSPVDLVKVECYTSLVYTHYHTSRVKKSDHIRSTYIMTHKWPWPMMVVYWILLLFEELSGSPTSLYTRSSTQWEIQHVKKWMIKRGRIILHVQSKGLVFDDHLNLATRQLVHFIISRERQLPWFQQFILFYITPTSCQQHVLANPDSAMSIKDTTTPPKCKVHVRTTFRDQGLLVRMYSCVTIPPLETTVQCIIIV